MGGAARGRGPHVVWGEGLARPGARQEAGEGVRRDHGRGDRVCPGPADAGNHRQEGRLHTTKSHIVVKCII